MARGVETGRRLTWGGAIAAVGAAAIALSPSAGVAGESPVFRVNSTADAHDFNTADPFCDSNPGLAGEQCTLRAGIEQTNAQPGADGLVVPAGTYGLNPAFSNLQVSDQLIIDGDRASNTVVRPTGPGIRILQVNGGARLDLRDVTVRDGVLGADGGGILNEGSLALHRSVVRNNQAFGESGGGIYSTGGLVVSDSTIAGNTAASGGGGLALDGSGSTPMTLSDVAITGNTAQDRGSGMFVADADATATNVTVSGNTSTADDQDDSAVFAQDAALSLRFATIAGNPQGAGAAFRLFSSGGGQQVTVELEASIVDSDAKPICLRNGAGTEALTSGGFNVLSSPAGCGAAGLDDLIAEPRLRPLADNGGPTMTRALEPSSKAVNRVAKGECPAPASDQRGVKRPQGERCDAGGYELARCAGTIVNRVGTGGKDRLRGTGRRDGFLLGGGKDKAKGRGGKDALCGGPGRDKLVGGPGRDKLVGGPGRDKCVGGPGRDVLRRCERGS